MKEYRVRITSEQSEQLFKLYYTGKSSVSYLKAKYGYVDIDGFDLVFDNENKYLSFIMTYM